MTTTSTSDTKSAGTPERVPTIITTEAGFLAAEKAIADLRAERASLDALIRSMETPREQTKEIEARIEPITNAVFVLVDDISASAPPTLRAAAIKLRVLTDEAVGPDLEDPHLTSVRQVIALLEEMGAAGRYQPLPAGISALELMIEVEDRISSMGSRINDAGDTFEFWLREQGPAAHELVKETGLDCSKIYELYEEIGDCSGTLLERIKEHTPTTLAEVLALLKSRGTQSIGQVIDALRAIAEKGGAS